MKCDYTFTRLRGVIYQTAVS